MSDVIVELVCLANGGASEFDGTYLVEYDPTRPGFSPSGEELMAHLVTTRDITKAKKMPFFDAWNYVKQSYGFRRDGQPNRPLTAFHLQFIPARIEVKVVGPNDEG